MQSGTIKKWNKDKGYGFIDVDNQSEDVFFHISKVRLSQPITIGQQVYFESARNDKGQLRATEVTSNVLSISENPTSKLSTHSSKKSTNSNQSSSKQINKQNNSKQKINNWSAAIFGLLGLLAVIYFGFIALQPSLTPEDALSTTSTTAITGDVQIDNTLALIQQGGPFPYPNKDGTTFGNRENRLPAEARGYYREYTVPTPGISHRGARRIVTGGNPPTVYYLTLDHYDSFSKLEVN